LNKKEIKALEFALKKHGNQKRKGTNLPYLMHPLSVYFILKTVTNDSNILIAGILHDIIEDTETDYKEIQKEFGTKTAKLVQEVTKNKFKQFPIKTKNGLLLKLADMMHNICNSEDKKYINKKLEFINTINGSKKKKTKKEEREELIEILEDINQYG
jgi:(p)ppGpp synthase/HD superfamily hydrolase